MSTPRHHRAFSLVELLVSMFVVAVLIGLLMPVLSGARAAGYRSVCATNQRQLGIAFVLYIQDNKETMPQHSIEPDMSDWKYGGAAIASASPDRSSSGDRPMVLDRARPINRYVDGSRNESSGMETVGLFSCPADRGVFARGSNAATRSTTSILGRGTCFKEFGTSYRANPLLLDSTVAGIDGAGRPLRMSDISVSPSRLLLLGDTAWYYATRNDDKPDSQFEASWHRVQDSGNMLAVDGSIRFLNFGEPQSESFTLRPRGE